MFKDFPLIKDTNKSITQFYPHIPKNYLSAMKRVFSTRWLGQGPLVDKLEIIFSKKFADNQSSVAVGSGTDALHLSYILAGIKKNDEVICPIFTCTATNIPLLYIGAKIKFADVDPKTLNINIESVKKLITKKTKAIVFVNYGGLPCNLDALKKLANKNKIKLIQDAAQSLGALYKKKPITRYSDFTIFSFQAIKQVTSGDGGMLVFKDKKILKKARRIRWFGIDRLAKQGGTWENDIKEIGYKYQMTDVSAAIGLAGLEEFDKISNYRKRLFNLYCEELSDFSDVEIVGMNKDDREHAAWLFTILVKARYGLQNKLAEKGIESNQMHFRNDRYSIFKEHCDGKIFPNMDIIENKYLVLPLHHKLSEEDVLRICYEIKSGW